MCGHFGKARHRLLYCSACEARSSEFKGTPLLNSKLPHAKVLSILEHLADGCGIRQTARLVGVSKDTVTRLALLAGRHAEAAHDELVGFPPSTREVQFDEKRSFVGEKRRNCDPGDPADDHCGDYWDYVAYDPEHRLVLAVIPGARTEENGRAIVGEVERRLGGGPPELMTSDEYPVYESAIRDTFGEPVPEERKPGRPRVVPERRVPEGVVYATVHKHREKGRVVAVEPRLVFGSEDELEEALGDSCASYVVSTSFVERQDATDRHRNARKGRKTYRFSKDRQVHEAMTYLTMYGYNFCWCVRTLRIEGEDVRWQAGTPAVAAGLTDHVWTWREWFTRPAIQAA